MFPAEFFLAFKLPSSNTDTDQILVPIFAPGSWPLPTQSFFEMSPYQCPPPSPVPLSSPSQSSLLGSLAQVSP